MSHDFLYCTRAVEMGSKNLGFGVFSLKPVNLKSPNFGFFL